MYPALTGALLSYSLFSEGNVLERPSFWRKVATFTVVAGCIANVALLTQVVAQSTFVMVAATASLVSLGALFFMSYSFSEYKDLDKQNNILKQNAEKLEQSLKDIKKEREKLQNLLEASQKENEVFKKESEATIQSIQKENTRIQASLKNAEKIIESANSLTKEIQAILEKQANIQTTLQKADASFLNYLSEIVKNVEQLAVTNKNMKQENEELRGQLKELQDLQQKLRQEGVELKESLKGFGNVQQENTQLKSQLEETLGKLEHTEKNLKESLQKISTHVTQDSDATKKALNALEETEI